MPSIRFWLALSAALVLVFVGYQLGDASGDVAVAKAEARAQKAERQLADARTESERMAREVEKRHAQALADVARKYEQDQADAQAAADRLAADLRAGNVRLRNLWQGCQATGRVSGAATGAAVTDAQDRLREASAGRIIGAVRACQAQRDALIDVVEADRQR